MSWSRGGGRILRPLTAADLWFVMPQTINDFLPPPLTKFTPPKIKSWNRHCYGWYSICLYQDPHPCMHCFNEDTLFCLVFIKWLSTECLLKNFHWADNIHQVKRSITSFSKLLIKQPIPHALAQRARDLTRVCYSEIKLFRIPMKTRGPWESRSFAW